MKKRVEELNFVAERQYTATIEGNMKGLKSHSDVNIYLYQNGVRIEGYPFYEYESKQAQRVLGDILEGYFPYDLKQKYPEGVPL